VTRRPRWSLRAQILAVALLALALAYVGTYYRLSRRGMREAKPYGIPGFLYVPVQEVLVPPHDLSRQRQLTAFYVPLNGIDRLFFGGDYPACCIMWRLSG
jgi:hypothetical protein